MFGGVFYFPKQGKCKVIVLIADIASGKFLMISMLIPLFVLKQANFVTKLRHFC